MKKRKKSSTQEQISLPKPSSQSVSISKRTILNCGAIAILTILAYWPVLHGGYLLDDDVLLTENALIRSSSGLFDFWFSTKATDYWPVSNSVLWLEWRAWGPENVTCFHCMNVACHITSALLLWALLRRLAIPGGFLAALLFAVHPVNVEAVAWITQLKTVLSLVLFMLSILCYVYHEFPDCIISPRRGKKLYSASFFFFAMAMLSKSSAAVLPIALLLIVYWKRPLRWTDVRKTLPFFAFGIAASFATYFFQHPNLTETVRHAGFLERFSDAGTAICAYVIKATLPVNLCFVYPKWSASESEFIGMLPLLFVIAATVTLWALRRTQAKPFFLVWIFYCAALFPTLGLIDVGFMKYSLIADRYQYFAILGVATLVGAGWTVWIQRRSEKSRKTFVAASGLLITALLVLTMQRAEIFSSAPSLYAETLRQNPTCSLAHVNFGQYLLNERQPQAAAEHFIAALNINPDNYLAVVNLGSCYGYLGDSQKALDFFSKAAKMRPKDFAAFFDRGIMYKTLQNYSAAKNDFQKAIELQPSLTEAHYHLAVCYAKLGEKPQAIEEAEKAIFYAHSQGKQRTVAVVTQWLKEYQSR